MKKTEKEGKEGMNLRREGKAVSTKRISKNRWKERRKDAEREGRKGGGKEDWMKTKKGNEGRKNGLKQRSM